MAGKMVMCVVHPEDAQDLVKVLNASGFYVTQASTTGGFLRQGKVTLMIGVNEEQVEQVMTLIRENTHRRSRGGWWARPGKHQEGAVVFVMGMEQVNLPD
jgi:uncharacterized protein YaaQ